VARQPAARLLVALNAHGAAGIPLAAPTPTVHAMRPTPLQGCLLSRPFLRAICDLHALPYPPDVAAKRAAAAKAEAEAEAAAEAAAAAAAAAAKEERQRQQPRRRRQPQLLKRG